MPSSRREFLKNSLGLLAALAVAPLGKGVARPKLPGSTYTPYPEQKVATFDEIQQAGQFFFTYPDATSPCLAIYVPNAGVVAYSTLCTHKGCPTTFNPKEMIFECPCHYSRFDVEKNGQEIMGQATERLPRIELEVRGNDVYAIGVNGLIFGRVSNVL